MGSPLQVLYRERAAGMYSALMYVHSAALVELPYLFAQVCIFAPIVYFMIGELCGGAGWQAGRLASDPVRCAA